MSRTFGPVVLAGLAAAALGAVAASKVWVALDGSAQSPALPTALHSDLGTMPLAAALGYLLLASWGVLLVTRGVVRRVFAVVALAVSVGVAVTVAWAPASLPDDVRERAASGTAVGTHLTGWYWAAVVSAVIAVLAAALAVRWVGTWPQMGGRYDAPTTHPTAPVSSSTAPGSPESDQEALAEDESLSVWKAQDEGRDPTA